MFGGMLSTGKHEASLMRNTFMIFPAVEVAFGFSFLSWDLDALKCMF